MRLSSKAHARAKQILSSGHIDMVPGCDYRPVVAQQWPVSNHVVAVGRWVDPAGNQWDTSVLFEVFPLLPHVCFEHMDGDEYEMFQLVLWGDEQERDEVYARIKDAVAPLDKSRVNIGTSPQTLDELGLDDDDGPEDDGLPL